jgi:alpha-tubulin suppressor-like RCC1 family protein
MAGSAWTGPRQDVHIQGGDATLFIIRGDGKLFGSGRNWDYRLGLGHEEVYNFYRQTVPPASWRHIASGENGSMGIQSDSSLWVWGNGSSYALANDSNGTVSQMTHIGSARWIMVTLCKNAGRGLGIQADSTLWAWGENGNGSLGLGDNTTRRVPTKVGTDKWIDVSNGWMHTLAIRADSTLWGWGSGWSGNLGDGTTNSYTVPTQIGSDKWIQIAAGDRFSLGLKADSTLWAWGSGWCAGTGLGNTNQYNIPTQVGSAKWRKIASPLFQSAVAIRADSTLWTWGSANGSLGTGAAATSQANSPVQITSPAKWKDVGSSRNSCVGLDIEGNYWAWGTGDGTVGDGTTTRQDSPVQIAVPGGTAQTITFPTPASAMEGDAPFNPGASSSANLTVSFFSSDTSIVKIVNGLVSPVGVGTCTITATQKGSQSVQNAEPVSRTLTVIAAPGLPSGVVPAMPTRLISGSGFAYIIAENGELYGTGNTLAQLTGQTNPSRTNLYMKAAEAGPWKQVASTNQRGGLAIKTDGSLWAWGENGDHALGIESTTSLTTPTRIGTDSWNYITSGKINSSSFGIKSDSTLWGWGQNWDGQLGDSTTTSHNLPKQIGTKKWAQVSFSYTHCLGIQSDGTLWGWGNNGDGNIGNGTTQQSLVPVQASRQKWITAVAGDRFSLGLRSDSTLWSWADGWCYGTGQGDNSKSFYPKRLGTDKWIKIVTPVHQVVVALRSDSTLWSWGSISGSARLGLGDSSSVSAVSPKQINTRKFKDVGGGMSSFIALDTEGKYWAWGTDALGAGDAFWESNVPVQIGVPGSLLATQIVNFSPIPSKTFGDSAFTLSATASTGLEVTFISSDPAVATVSGNRISIKGAGTTTITATQAGNANYATASQTQNLIVNKASIVTTSFVLGSDSLKSISDAPFRLQASAGANISVTFTSSDSSVARVSGDSVYIIKVGTTTLTALQIANPNYESGLAVSQVLRVREALPAPHKISDLSPNSFTDKVDTIITLSWKKLSGATVYSAQATYDSSVSTRILDTIVVDTSLILSGLKYDSTVYWRIAGIFESQRGDFSSYTFFKTRSATPKPIEVSQLPKLPESGVATSLEITLPQVEKATGYHIQVTLDTANQAVIDTLFTEPLIGFHNLRPGFTYHWRVAPVNGASHAAFTPWMSFKVKEGENSELTRSSLINSTVKNEVKLSSVVALLPKDSSLSAIQVTLTESKIAPSFQTRGFICLTKPIDIDVRLDSIALNDNQLTLMLTAPDTSLDGKIMDKGETPLVYLIDSLTGAMEVLYNLPRDSIGRFLLPLSKGKNVILAVDTLALVITDSTRSTVHESGSKVTISGMVSDNIGNSVAWVKYRRGGALHFDSASVQIDSLGHFQLPIAFALDSTGFEYHIIGTDGRNTRSTARTDMPVTISNVSSQDSIRNLEWSLFSIPSSLTRDSIAAVLGNLGIYGRYDDWLLFKRAATGLVECGSNLYSLTPGEAYWLKTWKKNVHIGITSGTTTPVNKPFTINIPAGTWISIANPYLFRVPWQAVLDSSHLTSSQLIGPYRYSDSAWIAPLLTNSIDPFKGYYVYNATTQDQIIKIPSIGMNAHGLTKTTASDNVTILDWQVSGPTGRDHGMMFGFADQPGLFPDWVKPESPEDGLVQSWFTMSNGNYGRFLTSFMPSSDSTGARWTVEVSGLVTGTTYAGSVGNIDKFSSERQLYIVDKKAGTVADLRAGDYSFVGAEGETVRSLDIVVGTAAYVQSAISQAQRLPQRLSLNVLQKGMLNKSLALRFEIPANRLLNSKHVSITLLNIQGRQIAKLVDGMYAPGYYTVTYPFTTKLSNAVYILALRLDKQVKTQQLTITR